MKKNQKPVTCVNCGVQVIPTRPRTGLNGSWIAYLLFGIYYLIIFLFIYVYYYFIGKPSTCPNCWSNVYIPNSKDKINPEKQLASAKEAAKAIIRRGTTAGYQDTFEVICTRLERNPQDQESAEILANIRAISIKTSVINSSI